MSENMYSVSISEGQDASPTIQAALDALPDHGGTISLPPGNLQLENPLVLSPGTIGRRNVRLLGAGTTGADSSSTTLWWRGDPSVPAVQIRGSHNTLEGFRLVAERAQIGVDVDWDAASGMEMTQNTLRHLCVQGPVETCVRLAATTPGNGDYCLFDDVELGGFTKHGVHVASRNMQSLAHDFRRVRLETGRGQGAIGFFLESGCARLDGCWFEGVDTLFEVEINSGMQQLNYCQAEGFEHVAICGGAVTGMPVVLNGGRYGLSVPPHGQPLLAVRGGPLLMLGVRFEGDYCADQFLVDVEGADWAPTAILADGCSFPTDQPRFCCDQRGTVILRGCRGLKEDHSEVSWSHWERSPGVTILGHAPSVTTSAPTVSPEPSALLNLVSTEQGFLPPRMTSEQRRAIPNPAEGLVVYDTDHKTLCVFGALGDWRLL